MLRHNTEAERTHPAKMLSLLKTPRAEFTLDAPSSEDGGAVLRLKGRRELLEDAPRLAQSIRLRNPYVDPMSVLQVDLLRRWRASDRQDDALLRALVACVNGVSQGLQNTG